MMIIKNAYVYTLEQGFAKKDTVIENGYFSDRERLPLDGETVIDAQENYLIPGLVDVHFITHRFVCAERNFGWRISKIRLVYMYEADYVIRRY